MMASTSAITTTSETPPIPRADPETASRRATAATMRAVRIPPHHGVNNTSSIDMRPA